MSNHRDTNEGLYARLAHATNHALTLIKDIHESLPSGADRPARVELLKALEAVRNEAWTHYHLNVTNLVSEKAFNEVREHFRHAYITEGWDSNGYNALRYSLRLSLSKDNGDTGFVSLVLTVDIDVSEQESKHIERTFIVSPFDGESLWSAVSTARHEAWAFLDGIKTVYNI